MAAAAAVVTPSGLEDGVSRSRGEGAGEVVVERGPGAAYHMFVVMEDLVEKLKLLHYEEELLRKNNLKPPSRWVPSSPTPGYGLGSGKMPSSGLLGECRARVSKHWPPFSLSGKGTSPQTWRRRRALVRTGFRFGTLVERVKFWNSRKNRKTTCLVFKARTSKNHTFPDYKSNKSTYCRELRKTQENVEKY